MALEEDDNRDSLEEPSDEENLSDDAEDEEDMDDSEDEEDMDDKGFDVQGPFNPSYHSTGGGTNMGKTHPSVGPSAPPKEKKKKEDKPYRRRWGHFGLCITATYGKRSGWGSKQGLRELIQNLYTLEKLVADDSADNVCENPNGTPRAVEWVPEFTENDRVQTFIAYELGKKPRPWRGKHNRKTALGFIEYRKDQEVFQLVNKDTKLRRSVWDMGSTTKENKPHQIGGHGIYLALYFLTSRGRHESGNYWITTTGSSG
jgi:hypothetical protein